MAAFHFSHCSGVFRAASSEAVKHFAAEAGLELLAADLSAAVDKASLLQEMGRTLGFPGWYGGNWDALQDCLTDLSWRPAAGYVLMIEGQAPLRIREDDSSVFLDILSQSAAHWAGERIAFAAVFVDPHGALALPALCDS